MFKKTKNTKTQKNPNIFQKIQKNIREMPFNEFLNPHNASWFLQGASKYFGGFGAGSTIPTQTKVSFSPNRACS